MKVWAVWTSLRPEKIRLDVRGNVVEALNHLGEKQPVPGSEYAASPAILYLVGPESVSAEPL